MKKTLFYFICLWMSANLYSQNIQWQKCLGGSAWDFNMGTSNIQQTNDGGYIVAGSTLSNNGDVSGNYGDHDVWVVKLDNSSNIVWQKCLGGTGYEFARSVYQTNDNGYIIAGGANLSNGQVTGNHGGNDFWIVKLDASGNLEWQKCFGGLNEEFARCVQQTSDGGYIIVGGTTSINGDVSGNHGMGDAWVVKLNTAGNIVWQKCLGGSEDEAATFIRQTPDNGYIMSGITRSTDGDISGNHGWNDAWIVKLDTVGNIQWQNCFGGSWYEAVYSIQPTAEGGYIFAGSTDSDDGDVSGHNYGDEDFWIVKLNSSGNLVWQKCLGGESVDIAYSIQQTTDGGYIAAGSTASQDGVPDTLLIDVVSGNHGGADGWIVKMDGAGNLSGQLCIGGSNSEEAYSIQQTTDGGYIIGAQIYDSNDGDVSGGHGGFDFWVVKLGATLSIPGQSPGDYVKIYPNPATRFFNVDLGGVNYEQIFLQITDLTGKIIMQQKYDQANFLRINMDSFEAGLYTYSLTIKGEMVKSGKIILN